MKPKKIQQKKKDKQIKFKETEEAMEEEDSNSHLKSKPK